jgi:hypothetical protein
MVNGKGFCSSQEINAHVSHDLETPDEMNLFRRIPLDLTCELWLLEISPT